MVERISVIVPAYNTAPWLGRCLDSLLAQTYPNVEIIVVNDGSSDETGAVLDDYAGKYDNIKAIHQENAGVTAARLRGLKESTGDLVGFVDGDDVVEPQMYGRLLENLNAHGADISHCGQQVLFPDGRVEKLLDSGELRVQDHLGALRDLLDGGTIESGLCTKLYRRSLFDGLDAWMDTSVKNNEDLLMNWYLFDRAEKSVFEAVCPYRYILRQGSASYRRPPAERIVRDNLLVRETILRDCEEALKDDARRALLRNALFLSAWLSGFHQRDYDPGRTLVRRTLKENKAYFGLLSARNRVLAQLLCTAPWAFDLAYRTYVMLFQKEEQH